MRLICIWLCCAIVVITTSDGWSHAFRMHETIPSFDCVWATLQSVNPDRLLDATHLLNQHINVYLTIADISPIHYHFITPGE